jgi:hypothetical protein
MQCHKFPKDLSAAAVLTLVWHSVPQAGLRAEWHQVLRC